MRWENTTVGSTDSVGYEYDPSGRLKKLTYPDGYAVDYLFDTVGRVREARTGSASFGTLAYFADDLVKDVSLGNPVDPVAIQSFTYNGRAWPVTNRATHGASTYLDLLYDPYDPSGNILAIGGSTQAPQTFSYDKHDRLRSASGGYGSPVYTYDAVGNRLTERDGVVVDRTLLPTANAATAWGRSGCTQNYQCVDDPRTGGDGDSTRITTGIWGATDLYQVQDLPAGSTNIASVTVRAYAKAAYACEAPPCWADVALRVNGHESPPLRTYESDFYETLSYTWGVNPGTGLPWTEAEVNALQAGVELVATDMVGHVTKVDVTVRVGMETTYTYNQMSELTSANRNGLVTNYFYDANGNLDFDGRGWDYSWDAAGRMALAKLSGQQKEAYVYDGLGRRVNVTGTSSAHWNVSIVSGMDVIYERSSTGSATKYVYANGMRIAKVTPSGAVHYYLTDHLGSTRRVLDANRNTVFSSEYKPFGAAHAAVGSESFRFAGERWDGPTGLVHLRARQYDPAVGRFVSADPMLGSLAAPQTLNRYAYVVNNPLRWVDPLGLFPTPAEGDGGFDDLREGGGAAGGLRLRMPGSSLYRTPGKAQYVEKFRKTFTEKFANDPTMRARVNEIADDALKQGRWARHQYGVVRSSLRLGDKVRGFGDKTAGEPDIFTKGGMKHPNTRWVEVKTGGVKADQLRDYRARWGPGEVSIEKSRPDGKSARELRDLGMADFWWSFLG